MTENLDEIPLESGEVLKKKIFVASYNEIIEFEDVNVLLADPRFNSLVKSLFKENKDWYLHRYYIQGVASKRSLYGGDAIFVRFKSRTTEDEKSFYVCQVYNKQVFGSLDGIGLDIEGN